MVSSRVVLIGTTSACAENTWLRKLSGPHTRNYLRVRGEYCSPTRAHTNASELPPRARRIQDDSQVCDLHAGTTSACAENTHVMLTYHTRSWNYLRVRGEYNTNATNPSASKELPPRARRIHLAAYLMNKSHGTTSACAENTSARSRSPSAPWNYLRVRGEYPK